MGFNHEVAADFYDEIIKMDDDSAEMMMRFTLFDVYTKDLQDNRRLLEAHTEDVQKSLAMEVVKALGDDNTQDAVDVLSLVALVSKDWNESSVKRDAKGRFATIAANKRGKLKLVEEGKKMPKGYFNLTGALQETGGRSTKFADRWNEDGPHDASTNARTYRRVEAGANAVGGLGGPKAQAATQVASFLGKHGPEAEKVVGPSMRRTAYRYRGTERKIDPALLQSAKDQGNLVIRREGISREEFDTPDRVEANTRAAIGYLDSKVPTARLAQLQQQSGKIPPSEGIMLNADGKIITQAVGYSDDHYLPFNLKNLKGLQGGSYIRTRSSGGPTTEDIYTGLVAGARSVTVVSRSGVFTVNFSDDFRGSRRYNDKAAQMVGRYAMTLDAVKSKQVDRQKVSLEDKAAIRTEVEEEIGEYASRQEIENEIQNRVKDFRVSTIPTKAEMDVINAKAEEIAAEGGKIKSGSTVGRSDRALGGVGAKQGYISDDHDTRRKLARQELVDELMETKAARQYQLDGEGYAVALEALREQFPYYLESPNFVHKKNVTAPEMRGKFSSETDAGYVKPRYIRPEGAKSGYYDESITGRGKISADRLNYANWPNNPENKGKARAEESSPVASATTPKTERTTPENPTQRMGRLVQQGRVHADEDAVTRKLVQNYAPSAGADFPMLNSLKGNPDGVDEVLRGGRRDDLMRELRDIHTVAQNGAPTQHAEGEVLFRSLDAASKLSGGVEYSKESLGRSPATPFKFEGNAYLPASPKAEYDRELGKQVARGDLDPKYVDYSDDDLRGLSAVFGLTAKHARSESKDDAQLITDLARAGAPTELIPQLVNRSKFGDSKTVAQTFEKKVEALERIRAVKAASVHGLHQSEARQKHYEANPPPALASEATSNAPKDLSYDADQLSEMVQNASAMQWSTGNHEQSRHHEALANAIFDRDQDQVKVAYKKLSADDQRQWRKGLESAGFEV